MSLKKYTVTLATTAALVGAGLTVPNALAEDAGTGAVPATAQAAPQDPVDGFSWPDVEVVAGGEVTITPSKTAGEKYRFVGSADGAGYTFSTDEKTGVITAKAPVNGYPGNSITITTQVHKLNADKSAYE